MLSYLTVRKENLHETGHSLPDRLAVSGIEVSAHREMSVDNLSEIMFPHIAECFCEVVNDKPVVVCEQLIAHLRNLPAWEIEVQTVDERHIIANNIGHRCEEMAGLNHDVDGLIGVAEQRDA